MTIAMYRPVGMEDEGVSRELIEEIVQYIGEHMEYLLLFGIYVCINILIASVLFIATRKTFKQGLER